MKIVVLVLACLVVRPAAAELPPEIARLLAGLKIPQDDVSVVVQAVDAPEPILAHLADAPRSPASVMKIVTTWSRP